MMKLFSILHLFFIFHFKSIDCENKITHLHCVPSYARTLNFNNLNNNPKQLIKKVNNKTATPQEREELLMMHEMDTLP